MASRNLVISWMVVGAWLACAACAFWYFALRDQRPFESATTALFDAAQRSESAETWFKAHIGATEHDVPAAIATVVHVYSTDCPCNRFTEPHLAEIVARYRASGVHFVTATSRLASNATPTSASPGGLLPVAHAIENELSWIDATPAALVYDRDGKLRYFGPYSDAAQCSTSNGMVERVLDRILSGQDQRPQRFFGGGCFCGADKKV